MIPLRGISNTSTQIAGGDLTDFTKLFEEELAVIFAERRAKLKALRTASFRWAAWESLYKAYIDTYKVKRRKERAANDGGSNVSELS